MDTQFKVTKTQYNQSVMFLLLGRYKHEAEELPITNCKGIVESEVGRAYWPRELLIFFLLYRFYIYLPPFKDSESLPPRYSNIF